MMPGRFRGMRELSDSSKTKDSTTPKWRELGARWERAHSKALANLTMSEWIIFNRISFHEKTMSESLETLAAWLPMSERSARAALRGLEKEHKLILCTHRTKGGAGHIAEYEINPAAFAGLLKETRQLLHGTRQITTNNPATIADQLGSNEEVTKTHAKSSDRQGPLSAASAYDVFVNGVRRHSRGREFPWPDDDGRTQAAVKRCGGMGLWMSASTYDTGHSLKAAFKTAYSNGG